MSTSGVRREAQRLRPIVWPVVALLILAAPAPSQAQGDGTRSNSAAATAPPSGTIDSLRLLLDRALASSALADFDRVLTLVEAERARHPDDPVWQHYRGFALYRKASVLLTVQPGDRRAKALLDEAERALASSASLRWPETTSLLGAVIGQLVGLSGPLAAMRMGPRAQRLLDDGVAQGAANPRTWMLRGISFLFRPKLLGGGADKAERDLRQSIALYAIDAPRPPAPQWGRAEVHGWLGEALARQGRTADAQREFQRALELEPSNVWVRDVLLPALATREREGPAAR